MTGQPKSPLEVAFAMVEDALRRQNVVAIAFVDPATDEYDPRDKVVMTTWCGDPEIVPEEHDHASSLAVAFKRAGGVL